MAGNEAELLRDIDREWAAAAAAGDLERILSFWTEDAKVYPPGAPVVHGKAAIRGYVGGALKTPGFSISWEPSESVVDSGGRVGYTTGRNQVTVPDEAGGVITSEGRYVTVWRKEQDGAWRCVIDMWNGGPPAPHSRG